MTKIGHNFPKGDDLPIPDDVQPGPGWTTQMLEMAEHIGAYKTMLIVSKYGGQHVYISADPARNTLRDLIGAEAAATLSFVYRREKLQIPTAKHALRRARRGPILALVRAKRMTADEATRILRTSRTYVAHLINETNEGKDEDPADWTPIGGRGRGHLAGQMNLFEEGGE